MLELQALSKRLGSFAIGDLWLTVSPGEYFVLLGPSGAGKTVLLEMIAGLIRPDAGRIAWEDRDITGSPPERRKFALMYQDYALFPHMKVAGNIGYGLAAAGVPRREAAARVAEVAGQLGIAGLLARRVESLSGGEQQRVALARAPATRPKMLLLDEPLSALDNQSRLQVRKLLRRVQRETRGTWIHVTHDLEEAMSVGDRIGVILRNRLCQVGTPEELFRTPSNYEVASFLGMLNVYRVEAAREGVCRVSGVEIDAAGASASTGHVWIKPEEIVLSREALDASPRNCFACTVSDWEHRGGLLAVRLACGTLELVALVTFGALARLEIRRQARLHAVFASSAVHCF